MTMEEYRNKKLELYRKISERENLFMDNACNNELCSKCKGACCRNFPCSFSPDDFVDINDIEYMKSVLDSGYFIISAFSIYESPSRYELVYYIRCRGLMDDNTIVSTRSPYENECIFHNEKGCSLDFYSRPSEGALLIPSERRYGLGVCENSYDYKKQIEDWRKCRSIMNTLIDYYKDNKSNNKKVDNINIYRLKKKLRKSE